MAARLGRGGSARGLSLGGEIGYVGGGCLSGGDRVRPLMKREEGTGSGADQHTVLRGKRFEEGSARWPRREWRE